MQAAERRYFVSDFEPGRPLVFDLECGGATGPRAGRLRFGPFEVPTPVFMPVGTRATVKTLGCEDLEAIGVRMVLGNTYHLHLRPGAPLIRARGGLRRFMAWSGAILTDSGGFQVFSLADLRRILPGGIEFRSHLDGSAHLFTPENVLAIQQDLGSDISMVLDVCSAWPADASQAAREMELTLAWARRSLEERARLRDAHAWGGALFGIVQGGVHPELRRRCAGELASQGFDGYALGGLSVGEPIELRKPAMDAALGGLPLELPRYLMGVGTPTDILDAVGRGVDMFDCVLPTRNARKGTIYTWNGRMVIKNRAYAEDDRPIDPDCGCPVCRRYTRAYLRHLFQVGEQLAGRLATLHTLAFYQQLTARARTAIVAGDYEAFASESMARLNAPVQD